jgi:hypothetical protein
MTKFRTLIAAALVAGSSSLAFAGEGLRIDTQSGPISARAFTAAMPVSETGVNLYERSVGGVIVEGRNAAAPAQTDGARVASNN